MSAFYKKIPSWVVIIITIMVVVVSGLMTYHVIGRISGMIDNFFK